MSVLKLVLFSFCLISSFAYSKSNVDNVKNVFSKGNVLTCEFKQDYMDFCENRYLKIYAKKINNTPNFSIDKILLILDKERDTGKGVPRIVKHVVVLDPKNNMVYPLQQSVGNYVDDRLDEIYNKPPKISFSKKENKICLSGTTYSLYSSNVNVENECYIFNEDKTDYFRKLKKEEKIVNENIVSKESFFQYFWKEIQ